MRMRANQAAEADTADSETTEEISISLAIAGEELTRVRSFGDCDGMKSWPDDVGHSRNCVGCVGFHRPMHGHRSVHTCGVDQTLLLHGTVGSEDLHRTG